MGKFLVFLLQTLALAAVAGLVWLMATMRAADGDAHAIEYLHYLVLPALGCLALANLVAWLAPAMRLPAIGRPAAIFIGIVFALIISIVVYQVVWLA